MASLMQLACSGRGSCSNPKGMAQIMRKIYSVIRHITSKFRMLSTLSLPHIVIKEASGYNLVRLCSVKIHGVVAEIWPF